MDCLGLEVDTTMDFTLDIASKYASSGFDCCGCEASGAHISNFHCLQVRALSEFAKGVIFTLLLERVLETCPYRFQRCFYCFSSFICVDWRVFDDKRFDLHLFPRDVAYNFIREFEISNFEFLDVWARLQKAMDVVRSSRLIHRIRRICSFCVSNFS